jgi:hypothetical protein
MTDTSLEEKVDSLTALLAALAAMYSCHFDGRSDVRIDKLAEKLGGPEAVGFARALRPQNWGN